MHPPVDPIFPLVAAADFRTLVLVAAGELQQIASGHLVRVPVSEIGAGIPIGFA